MRNHSNIFVPAKIGLIRQDPYLYYLPLEPFSITHPSTLIFVFLELNELYILSKNNTQIDLYKWKTFPHSWCNPLTFALSMIQQQETTPTLNSLPIYIIIQTHSDLTHWDKMFPKVFSSWTSPCSCKRAEGSDSIACVFIYSICSYWWPYKQVSPLTKLHPCCHSYTISPTWNSWKSVQVSSCLTCNHF